MKNRQKIYTPACSHQQGQIHHMIGESGFINISWAEARPANPALSEFIAGMPALRVGVFRSFRRGEGETYRARRFPAKLKYQLRCVDMMSWHGS